MSRRIFALLAIVGLLLVLVPAVLASVRTEDGGQVPFYARAPRGDTKNDGEWAVIPFYRSPSCVPAGFNLLDFFDFPDGIDFGAFDCQPPTTDNFAIWKNGPNVDFAPVMSQFHGLGAVPVWFVRMDEMEAAVADDVLTIGELAGLPSLLTGTATYYKETLHPGESPSPAAGRIQLNADGELTDGRTFQVRVTSNGTVELVHITFR